MPTTGRGHAQPPGSPGPPLPRLGTQRWTPWQVVEVTSLSWVSVWEPFLLNQQLDYPQVQSSGGILTQNDTVKVSLLLDRNLSNSLEELSYGQSFL